MNKTVLITGASKGIGFSLANKFLENGYRVIGTSTSGIIKGIDSENFKSLQLDLSDLKNIEIFKNELDKNEVKIDILINNAGIGPDLRFTKPEEITFKQTFEVNVFGTTFLTEALLGTINDEGKIIIISSKMGSVNLCEGTDSVAYRMSKAALNMYTKILANKLSGEMTVASVHPGWVKTTIAENNMKDANLSTDESAKGIYDFTVSDFKNGMYWDVEAQTELAW